MILPSLQTSTCPKQNQKSQPTDLIHEKEPSIHPKLQGCKTIPVTTDAQRGMGKNYLGPPRWMINNSMQKHAKCLDGPMIGTPWYTTIVPPKRFLHGFEKNMTRHYGKKMQEKHSLQIPFSIPSIRSSLQIPEVVDFPLGKYAKSPAAKISKLWQPSVPLPLF